MKNAQGEKKIVKLNVQWLKLLKILLLIKKKWSSVLQENPVLMGDVVREKHATMVKSKG